MLKFQSTLPRGSDQMSLLIFAAARFYFNPRSLAGATNPDAESGGYPKYFNPRSLAGATG